MDPKPKRLNFGAGTQNNQTYPWKEIESEGGAKLVFRPYGADDADLGIGAESLDRALEKIEYSILARRRRQRRREETEFAYHVGMVKDWEEMRDIVWIYGHPSKQECVAEECQPDFLLEDW